MSEFKKPNYQGTTLARTISVIETKTTIGNGTPEDPVRVVVQYWHLDGTPVSQPIDSASSVINSIEIQ